jgi:protein-S-isoprenylcysteine O-methyltransferase Ste14
MDPKRVAKYAIRETAGVLVMGAALFWSAGRVDWWQAWAALAVMSAWTIGMAVVIFHFRPELLAERMEPRRDTRRWDVLIVRFLGNITFAQYIVAGLDQRFGWTGGFPLIGQLAGLAAGVLGNALCIWAMATNGFFSQFVRVQSDRAHAVVSGGPYRYLRHPAYLGTILYELTLPFLLASWWAMIPCGMAAILLIIRTALEDRTLQADLPGYAAYARQVRYRLLPGIW